MAFLISQHMHGAYGLGFLIESVFTSIVIILCTIIYLKARNIYNLTEHRGIKYFSRTFLFLAIAYFFRFFFRFFFRLYKLRGDLFMPMRNSFRIGCDTFVFASTMAALFMLYSVTWKKSKKKEYTLLLYFIALIITIIHNVIQNMFFHLAVLCIIFLSATFISYYGSRKKQKHTGLFFAYLMISLFWILNIAALEIPRFMPGLKILIYMISLGLFLIILIRLFMKNE